MDTGEDHGATDTNSTTSRATPISFESQNDFQADTDQTSWPTMSTELDNSLHTSCTEGKMDIPPEAMSQNQATHSGNRSDTTIQTAFTGGKMDIPPEAMSQNQATHSGIRSDTTIHTSMSQNQATHSGNGSDTTIHTSCTEGKIDIPPEAMSQNQATHSRNRSDTTIHTACTEGKIDIPPEAMSQNQATHSGNRSDTTIHTACTEGKIDIPPEAMSQNQATHSGNISDTTIHTACTEGKIDIPPEAMSQNQATHSGNGSDTTIHTSCTEGKIDIPPEAMSQNQATHSGNRSDTTIHTSCTEGKIDIPPEAMSQNQATHSGNRSDTTIHTACTEGKIDIPPEAMSQNQATHSGNGSDTTIHTSCTEGKIDIPPEAMSQNQATHSGNRSDTTIHTACTEGKIDIPPEAMSQNQATHSGNRSDTTIHTACTEGKIDFPPEAMSQNQATHSGNRSDTTIHTACTEGKIDFPPEAMSQNQATHSGNRSDTTIHTACTEGKIDFPPEAMSQNQATHSGNRSDTTIHTSCTEGKIDIPPEAMSQNQATHSGNRSDTTIHTSCTEGKTDIPPEAMSQNQAPHSGNRSDTTIHTSCKEEMMDHAHEALSRNEADINVMGNGGMTPLMEAAAAGNLAGLISLLYTGGDVSLSDADGNDTLHYACIGGNVDVVKRVLIQDPVEFNKRGKWGRTPIMLAAQKGHEHIFNLLKGKCDLTLVSDHGDNILHLACLGGSVAITRYILSKDIADINGRGRYERTPLMKAAWGGNVEVFKEISRRGGDESLVDDHGSNVLHIACHRDNVTMVKYLISENIAGINSRGRMGRTPVMLAAANGQKKVFRLLVDEGVDLLLLDDNHENILHMACLGGNEDILKYMIFGTMKNILSQGNISVHSRGMKKRTSLMAAAEGGHIGTFDFLVAKGANLSAQDKLGNNIFHAACLGGNESMVKYILEHGFVDIDCTPKNDRLALMLAAEKQHRQVFDYLRQIQTPDFIHVDKDFNNILHVACTGGDVAIVKYLLSRKMDINIRGNRSRTPLMFAAENGHRDVFDLLVMGGADVSLEDDAGNTILHVACVAGHFDMVKYILSRGYIQNYIETKGEHGQTPVMLAAKAGHKSVFYLLVCKGASLSLRDYDGNNILQVACIGGHVKMVECLLSNDIVDINELRQDGKSALMLAIEYGHKEVIGLLQSSGAE